MPEEQQADTTLWMVTFSDLVMLLLTFFVLLLTMSSLDSKKLTELFTHFRAATGLLEFSGTGEIRDLATFVQHYNDSDSMLVVDHTLLQRILSTDLDKELIAMLKDNDQNLTISDDARGIVLNLNEKVLFEPGAVVLKKEALPVLDGVVNAIINAPNDVLIMGHSDGRPINSGRFKSNWELSAYRGMTVLDYFVKQKGIPPERLAAGGYGAAKPLYPNDTAEHRALNRRVEIIFKHLREE